VWLLWVLGGLVAWFVVGALVALVIGKMIRVADQRAPRPVGAAPETAPAPVTVSRPDATTTATAPVASVTRRLRVPLPPFAIGLVAVAVALETAGYVSRITGASGQAARLLSMDAPFSVPRMFVAALFGAAALAAVAGAGSIPGRRTWWTAVALVAAVVCGIKAGSTLHAEAVARLSEAISLTGAVLVSVTVAGLVVGALWFLSRTERRDRRRVLSALALYAGASVGLSAVSSALAGAYGSAGSWVAAATYVEETGEALAAVGMLVAVLAGVAPKLVLPADWALRRTVDPYTLDVPEPRLSPPPVGDTRS
jgi:hypothetical protein